MVMQMAMTLRVGDQSSPRIEAHILNECQARDNNLMLNKQDAYMAIRVDVLNGSHMNF